MLITPKDLPKMLFSVNNECSQLSNSIDFENISFNQLIGNYESNLITEAYEKYKTTRKIAEKLDISQTKASKLIKKYIK